MWAQKHMTPLKLNFAGLLVERAAMIRTAASDALLGAGQDATGDHIHSEPLQRCLLLKAAPVTLRQMHCASLASLQLDGCLLAVASAPHMTHR